MTDKQPRQVYQKKGEAPATEEVKTSTEIHHPRGSGGRGGRGGYQERHTEDNHIGEKKHYEHKHYDKGDAPTEELKQTFERHHPNPRGRGGRGGYQERPHTEGDHNNYTGENKKHYDKPYYQRRPKDGDAEGDANGPIKE